MLRMSASATCAGLILLALWVGCGARSTLEEQQGSEEQSGGGGCGGAVAPCAVEGTFDFVFGGTDHATGSFRAPVCDPAQPTNTGCP
jgi:hypothetical protein